MDRSIEGVKKPGGGLPLTGLLGTDCRPQQGKVVEMDTDLGPICDLFSKFFQFVQVILDVGHALFGGPPLTATDFIGSIFGCNL